MCFDIKIVNFFSCILKGAVTWYLEIVCKGQVRPLKSVQVRSIAKLAPHLQKIHAIITIIIFYFILFLH